jgi:hypothetical protein
MTENPEKNKKSRLNISDFEKDSIYTNQLNSSTAKQQYSLSKEPRFKEKKK